MIDNTDPSLEPMKVFIGSMILLNKRCQYTADDVEGVEWYPRIILGFRWKQQTRDRGHYKDLMCVCYNIIHQRYDEINTSFFDDKENYEFIDMRDKC